MTSSLFARPGRRLARPALAAVLAAGVFGIAACGGGSAASTAAAAASPTASAPSDRARGGFDPAQLTAIRQCLAAAGITLPTPSAFPGGNGSPGSRPSLSPRPSGGFPSGGFPSGGPGGGAGGIFSVLRSPEAIAALKACGLSLPTRPTGGPDGGQGGPGSNPLPTASA